MSKTLNRAQVHAFAVKWREFFVFPQVNWIPNCTNTMRVEMEALGWQMDVGESFKHVYPEAGAQWFSLAWQAYLPQVFDLWPLGNVIYSAWRQITHWLDADLLWPEFRKWFIATLDRLATISTAFGEIQSLCVTRTSGLNATQVTLFADGRVMVVNTPSFAPPQAESFAVASLTAPFLALSRQCDAFIGLPDGAAADWHAQFMLADGRTMNLSGMDGDLDDRLLQQALGKRRLVLF